MTTVPFRCGFGLFDGRLFLIIFITGGCRNGSDPTLEKGDAVWKHAVVIFMRNKRILIVLSLLVMTLLPLAAAQVTVDWNWVVNDPGVQYFRYQMDGQSEDGWTVVDSSVTSYSASGLDGSKAYTLYLQQSYDGVYWSQSASSTSQPVIPQEAEISQPVVTEEVVEPVVEDVVVEEPVVAEEPAAVEETVIEEPVAEEPVVESVPVAVPAQSTSSSSPFRFTLSFAGGVGLNGIGDKLDYDYQVLMQLGFEDILANSVAGWDIRMNLGLMANSVYDIEDTTADNFFDLDQYAKSMYFDLLTGVNFKAGDTIFYLDGGARLLMNHGFGKDGELFALGNFHSRVQVTGLLGFRWNIGWFHLGLEGQYVYDFEADTHAVTPRLLMGFSF